MNYWAWKYHEPFLVNYSRRGHYLSARASNSGFLTYGSHFVILSASERLGRSRSTHTHTHTHGYTYSKTSINWPVMGEDSCGPFREVVVRQIFLKYRKNMEHLILVIWKAGCYMDWLICRGDCHGTSYYIYIYIYIVFIYHSSTSRFK